MTSTKIVVISVFAVVFLITVIVSTGCKSQQRVVNTDSMPGHALSDLGGSGNRTRSDGVIYLGSDYKQTSTADFGPKDVSFDFKTLRR
jgi:hypothetical protein